MPLAGVERAPRPAGVLGAEELGLGRGDDPVGVRRVDLEVDHQPARRELLRERLPAVGRDQHRGQDRVEGVELVVAQDDLVQVGVGHAADRRPGLAAVVGAHQAEVVRQRAGDIRVPRAEQLAGAVGADLEERADRRGLARVGGGALDGGDLCCRRPRSARSPCWSSAGSPTSAGRCPACSRTGASWRSRPGAARVLSRARPAWLCRRPRSLRAGASRPAARASRRPRLREQPQRERREPDHDSQHPILRAHGQPGLTVE